MKKLFYILPFLFFLGVMGWIIRTGNKNRPYSPPTVLAGSKYVAQEGKAVLNVPDAYAFRMKYATLSQAFGDINYDLVASTPFIDQKKSINLSHTEGARQVASSFDLSQLVVTTEYTGRAEGSANTIALGNRGLTNIKQKIKIKNLGTESQEVSLSLKSPILAKKINYEGKEYTVGEKPLTFQIHEEKMSVGEYAQRTGKQNLRDIDKFSSYESTFLVGGEIVFQTPEGQTAGYNWMDVANLPHSVSVYREKGETIIKLTVQVTVSAGGETIVDPSYDLNTSSTYNVRYDGATANANLTYGPSIATGDVNGDTISDLIIGAPYANFNGRTNSGSVYVIFGARASGNKSLATASSYNLRYDGADVGYALGQNVVVGDVNGDGLGDLLIQENTFNVRAGATDYVGGVYIIYSTLIDDTGVGSTGNNKDLSSGNNYNIKLTGQTFLNDYFGTGGIVVGDLNGDRVPDLAVGAPNRANGASNLAGSVYVFYSTKIDDFGVGSTNNNLGMGTTSSFNIEYKGQRSSDYLSRYRAIAIGDVNGDDLGDLVMGAPLSENNFSDAGSIYVVYSTTIDDISGTGNQKTLWTTTNYNVRFDGNATQVYLGNFNNFIIGDVNGDNLNDLIMGSADSDYNSADSGSVYVIFSTLMDDFVGTGTTKALNNVGNFNLRFDGGAASQYISLGGNLASGDLNRDGKGDLVIGAYSADVNVTDSGSAYVIYSTKIDDYTGTGNTASLASTKNFNIRYDGATAGDALTSNKISDSSTYYGRELAIDDVDGDGFSDLVMGAPYANNISLGRTDAGSVYVVLSSTFAGIGTTANTKRLNDTANFDIRYDGAAANDWLGYMGALKIGDANGDYLPDLLMGTWAADNNSKTNSGSVWQVNPVTSPWRCYLEENAADSQIIVNWDDKSTEEDYFQIQKSINGGTFVNFPSGTTPTPAANATSFTDTLVSSNNTYQYRIRAVANGLYSSWCFTPILNLGVGSFKFQGVKMEGVKIN